MNSNLLLIKFNVSAMSGSSNMKPVEYLFNVARSTRGAHNELAILSRTAYSSP
jgi:hypothetical protein